MPGQISKARFYSDFPIALDPDPDFRIHIYPNPSSGLIKFIWPGDQKNPMEITVFSLSGQKLISNLIYDYSGEIDLSGYQSGIYLVVARTENQVITKKIILYR
ncbi:MAG: T9SS type A sorting domain-containing protein [Bacteroidia bacterium]